MSDMVSVVENLAPPNEISGIASIGWWGTVLLIANETILFIVLLSAHFYLRANAVQWLPAEIASLDITFPMIATTLLFISSIFAQISVRTLRNGLQGRSTLFIFSSLGFGSLFVAVQIYEGLKLPFLPSENAFAALFLLITGVHLLHVLIGLAALAFVTTWIGLGSITSKRIGYLQNVVLYWHFVFVIWLIIFAVLYLSLSF